MIDCIQENCIIEHTPRTQTLVAFTPLYDKNGKQINIDPNSYYYRKRCVRCNREWTTVRESRWDKESEIDTEILAQ